MSVSVEEFIAIMSHPPRRRSGLSYLVAPLFLISLILHGLLLTFSLPSGSDNGAEPPPEVPESDAEEAAVDLLSISSLATEAPAPPEPTPAAPAAPAASPSQPRVPATTAPSPEEPPPSPQPESLSEPEPSPEPEMTPTPSGFDPARQQQLVGNAVGAIGREPGQSNFDVTSGFPGNAWDVPVWDTDISRWPAQKRNCFFRRIDSTGYELAPGAVDLRYLSRNLGLVVSEDLPRTFPNQAIQSVEGGYCRERLYRVSENGAPVLWISLVGIGDGDPSATAAVIFWSQDPTGGSGAN